LLIGLNGAQTLKRLFDLAPDVFILLRRAWRRGKKSAMNDDYCD
jgi:hypothetical protein